MPPRTADLEQLVLKASTRLVEDRVEKAKTAVRRAAVREATNILHWLANQIRSELGAAPSELRQQMGIGWHSLSTKRLDASHWRGAPLSYQAFKRREFDNQAFFLLDGGLAASLDAVVPSRAFGTVDVRSQPVSVTFRGQGGGSYQVKVKLFPRLPPGNKNGDLAWLVAQQTSSPKVTWGKLMNPMGRPRQLLLPTLLYFSRERIPRVVKNTLMAHGFKLR